MALMAGVCLMMLYRCWSILQKANAHSGPFILGLGMQNPCLLVADLRVVCEDQIAVMGCLHNVIAL